MATWLKQSTAVDIGFGPFLDDTDGKTAETALTITQPDIRLKKNGGAWAQKNAAQTLSHEEAGWYEIALDTTDTDTLGILIVAVHESGALPVWREFMVVPANVYDSMVGGSDTLQSDVTQISGSAVSTSTAQLGVNAVQAGGTAWGSGAITAASIASSAIADTKIATGAITSAKFAAGAIDAAAIAADAIGASELAADAVAEIADGILDRNMATGADNGTDSTAVRTVRQALRALRNRVNVSSGTITVYKEDDTTASWTAATTTDAAADPVTQVNPT